MADQIRPAQRVGSWVKFRRDGYFVECFGTITNAISRDWITHKPAYMVRGEFYTGVVHDFEVLEFGPVRV